MKHHEEGIPGSIGGFDLFLCSRGNALDWIVFFFFLPVHMLVIEYLRLLNAENSIASSFSFLGGEMSSMQGCSFNFCFSVSFVHIACVIAFKFFIFGGIGDGFILVLENHFHIWF